MPLEAEPAGALAVAAPDAAVCAYAMPGIETAPAKTIATDAAIRCEPLRVAARIRGNRAVIGTFRARSCGACLEMLATRF